MLDKDGTAWLWSHGREPHVVIRDVAAIAADYTTSADAYMAIKKDGSVWIWGRRSKVAEKAPPFDYYSPLGGWSWRSGLGGGERPEEQVNLGGLKVKSGWITADSSLWPFHVAVDLPSITAEGALVTGRGLDSARVCAWNKSENKIFDHWEGDTGFMETPFAPESNVSLKNGNASVKAVFKNKCFKLEVENGKGSGEYPHESEVEIAATLPPGEMFESWKTVSGYNIQLPKSAAGTIKVPAWDIKLAAKFRKPVLTVNNGLGGGRYAVGEDARVNAAMYYGKIFDKWVGDTVFLENPGSPVTKLRIPAADSVITATYSDSQ